MMTGVEDPKDRPNSAPVDPLVGRSSGSPGGEHRYRELSRDRRPPEEMIALLIEQSDRQNDRLMEYGRAIGLLCQKMDIQLFCGPVIYFSDQVVQEYGAARDSVYLRCVDDVT